MNDYQKGCRQTLRNVGAALGIAFAENRYRGGTEAQEKNILASIRMSLEFDSVGLNRDEWVKHDVYRIFDARTKELEYCGFKLVTADGVFRREEKGAE